MLLNIEKVESELINSIKEIKEKFKLDLIVTSDIRPGSVGITSQILITVMGRLGNKFDVNIPNNCYIFYDRETKRQLSIKEAAQKLIKVVTNGK